MRFSTATFTEFDREVIDSIPYFEDLALSCAPKDAALYILDSFYSGFSICIG
jgi:hypothetical protein